MSAYCRALTVAGSDSGGGAGIQADLKTFQACGCYGMSVITAITAQNTVGVTDIHPVPVQIIGKQIIAVLEDIGADCVKIGMLHSVPVIECVADTLKKYTGFQIVLDPVMVATSGDRLIEDDAIAAMKTRLFSEVSLLTPNLPEAEVLLEAKIPLEQMAAAARELAEQYKTAVLLKGGHLNGTEVMDVFCDAKNLQVKKFTSPRIETQNTHGTGCTLSSSIAAFLARGFDLETAVQNGREYLYGAIKAGAEKALGNGHGPVHHSYRFVE